jgi:hypothetical protein
MCKYIKRNETFTDDTPLDLTETFIPSSYIVYIKSYQEPVSRNTPNEMYSLKAPQLMTKVLTSEKPSQS